MARWARNPPDKKKVKFVLAIFAVCFIVYAIEYFVGWPDMLSMDPRLRRMRP
ncbi:hypothetical protein [Roseovarius sp. SYSU LYC5161]|uniref:hypothetical protein n=1 Tax=Roseovarius halophilus (ex Wu et al. 2025) TaxID=3376060 RepID=UPI003999665F